MNLLQAAFLGGMTLALIIVVYIMLCLLFQIINAVLVETYDMLEYAAEHDVPIQYCDEELDDD